MPPAVAAMALWAVVAVVRGDAGHNAPVDAPPSPKAPSPTTTLGPPPPPPPPPSPPLLPPPVSEPICVLKPLRSMPTPAVLAMVTAELRPKAPLTPATEATPALRVPVTTFVGPV